MKKWRWKFKDQSDTFEGVYIGTSCGWYEYATVEGTRKRTMGPAIAID